MTIDEAREAILTLEGHLEDRDRESVAACADEATRARSHECAWTLVYEGTPEERRTALTFWAMVEPPQGVPDALAELYLAESPPDAMLRAHVGEHHAQSLSDEVGRRLARRFAADPEAERDLALTCLRFDAHGGAWDGLIRLTLMTTDAQGLARLFQAADEAGRGVDFAYVMRGKPVTLVRELAALIPSPLREVLARATGTSTT